MILPSMCFFLPFFACAGILSSSSMNVKEFFIVV
nr:MAG TPA: hypothetical protein [Caudoviricetes sp.]